MAEELGRHHPLVKRIRALRGSSAARRAAGVFLAEGLHLADEALRRRAPVEGLVHSRGFERTPAGAELIARVRHAGLELHAVAADLMRSLQDARSPQPVLTLVRLPESIEPGAGVAALLGAARVLLLHGVQDPGNLGSLVRSAHAAGAAHVWIDGAGCDPFHPRAVRATMGSIFAVPVTPVDLTLLLPLLHASSFVTWAACSGGGRDYRDLDFGERAALVLGAEGAGLPEPIVGACRGRVTIPMCDGVESLSVAAAGAVLLFATCRREISDG